MPSEPQMPLVAVTGSQRPYIFDLPHLLSLPDGFEFRFRYQRKWVADDLKGSLEQLRWYSRIRDSEKILAGRTLVLVYHSQEQKRLVPVRQCTVIAIELLGPMVFVRFRVGPIVRVSEVLVSSPSNIDAQARESARLTELGTRMLDLPLGRDLSKPLPEGFYLRSSAAVLDDGDWKPLAGQFPDDVAAWASLAALLQTEPHLYRVPFFRLMGFQRKDGTYRDPEDIKRAFTVSTKSTRGFRLVEGERYRLRLLEWCETNKGTVPGATVTATVAQDLIFLEGASNVIVGKYDVLEFACVARRPGYGEVAIRVDPPADEAPSGSPLDRWNSISASGGTAGAPWPFFYAARVPIHVRHNRCRVMLLGIIGVLGIGLYVWGPAVQLPVVGLKVPREIAQLAGLVTMFTALGEYLQRFVKFSSGLKDLPLGGGLPATK